MAYSGTVYGDITPRQAAFSIVGMLKRALPLLVIEKFGQVYPLPKNNTGTAKWRRYFMTGGTGAYSGNAGNYSIPTKTTPLTEGVTPAGTKLANKDYTVQLQQYGDWIGFTDVIVDLHEDFPAMLRELTDILAESAAVTLETLRFNVLKAGTNVFYGNGVARASVNTPITLALQRRVTRALKRQNARQITSVVGATPNVSTSPIEAAFIALVHTDLETDIRGLAGFVPASKYASAKPMEGEIGAVEDVRYIRSTVFQPFADAGGAAGSMLSTTGTNADVYPMLYIARDAYGIVPLKGQNAVTPMIVQPKPTESDPLAQRGTASWKAWNATVILQDAFLVRVEVAATA